MTWGLPNEDAVTLGELHGELYAVSRHDRARVSDEFTRCGGRALNPARVASTKPLRPRALWTTNEPDEEQDSGAWQLLKRVLTTGKALVLDDELVVLKSALDAAVDVAERLMEAVTGTRDKKKEEKKVMETSQDWSQSESIVDLSWHCTKNVLAVAQMDGVVALYHVESASWDTRVLEHPEQTDIGSIEWGRYTGETLAVACSTGVFLWQVPVAGNKEPVLKEILKHSSSGGFRQVSWNADGSLLAALGTKGSRSAVVVFDAVFSRQTELESPYKLKSLHWSPTGEYLNGVSLMWETLTWKRETWEVAAGGCGWSSNGRCLMVALRDSALLYPYIFQDCPPSLDAQISSPALDFTPKTLFSLDQSTSAVVGGFAQDIAWDPSGSRVAVTYRTEANGSHQAGVAPLVCIFSVVWQPFLIFTRRFVVYDLLVSRACRWCK
uniref:Anaphase-promoting complex subunit 4-like WD40 domain-containing protein n=1 Tax=Hyaloperonospora arabidopsidis (strain Emoy2) TaxID=559515 RepID=M4B1C7_HYAAE